MSDDDLEGAPFNVWFDSEVHFPDISSVSTMPYMGVSVSSPSANTQHVWAQEKEDSSAMNSAPIKGNQAGNVPLEEEGPHKGDDLLDSPIHTPPQSKSPSPFLCHRGWAMGSGRGIGREGVEKALI